MFGILLIKRNAFLVFSRRTPGNLQFKRAVCFGQSGYLLGKMNDFMFFSRQAPRRLRFKRAIRPRHSGSLLGDNHMPMKKNWWFPSLFPWSTKKLAILESGTPRPKCIFGRCFAHINMNDYLALPLGEHQEGYGLRERGSSAKVAFWFVFCSYKHGWLSVSFTRGAPRKLRFKRARRLGHSGSLAGVLRIKTKKLMIFCLFYPRSTKKAAI